MNAMSTDTVNQEETVTATIDLTLSGRKGRLTISVPTGPKRPIDLLPLLQSLTDTLVKIGAEQAEANDGTISCRKGCGACCRQLVPISEVEAESIRNVVQKLPEARRSVVIERFEHARLRLDEAGLLEKLHTPSLVDRGHLLAFGMAYFEQGIPCPFLEEESCSIHADRPLSCREYLVLSPAANCAKPTPSTINCVKVPASVARAIRHIDPDRKVTSSPWLPLVLAIESPLVESDPPALHAGTALMANVLTRLFGKDIQEPAAGQSGDA
jgi:Fe-S-cluster containining protein